MTPKFSAVKKDRLFYDRFEYCIGFHLDEANCLRKLDHASIDDIIQRRQKWREIAQMRWINGMQKHGTILGRRFQEITETTVAHLHALAEMLITNPTEFKLVVNLNQGYVYTNDLILINRLDRLPMLEYKTFTQAQIVRPKNTVALQKTKHKFRTFFKTMNLTAQQREHLENFLIGQSELIRISPALQRWIDQPFVRVQDYFFVDHDSETWLTMLNLVLPGLTRKTMHIITAK